MAGPLLLQANLNHYRRAQDLLGHVLVDWGVHVAVVTEPFDPAPDDRWHASGDRTVSVVNAGRNDPRGRALASWASDLDLRVLNHGGQHTCVRWNGGSVVDLAFASPAALARLMQWRVHTGVETLSDHRGIQG